MWEAIDVLHVAGPTSGKSNTYALVRSRIFPQRKIVLTLRYPQ
jgi:hypothetical protein